ncbi:aldo/keto reductase [Sphingomonas sp. MS122]|uniref:aldo/keto reductase n=1 Tax=Sphingomonas sp. MS122 TaxID=3412683 RepID=UPI003C2E1B13
MIQHRLGRTGLDISACTLGTSALASPGADRREAGAMITRALERGVNAVELDGGHGRVADLLGEVLARTGARRQMHVFARVTSLVRFDLPSPHIPAQQAYPGRHIRTETEALLRTLGVERLGLQQIHAWCPEWLDEGDWLETLERLREEGKIAGYGLSLWDHDLDAAATILARGVAGTVQLMHNIFDPSATIGLLPFCQRADIGVVARSPLYFGALGWDESRPALAPHDWRGGYFYDAHRRETLARVHRLAREIAPSGQMLPEVALRFALSHPAVTTVAVGMRTCAQLEANLAAIERGPLQADEMKALAAHAWLC